MNKKLFLSLALCGLVGASLPGALVLYDDFDGYTAGTVNGDTGLADTGSYSGNWAGDTAGGVATFETGAGLSYPGMTTTDGVLQIQRSSGSFAGFYNARIDPAGGAGNSALYFSGLINVSAGTEGVRFGLDLSDDTTKERRSEIGFTAAGNAAIWNSGEPTDFDDAGLAPVATSSGTYGFGTTYLLVGKIEDASNWAGSNDRVSLWLNPVDGVEGNNAALLTAEVGFNGLFPTNSNISQFALQAGTQSAGNTVQFDELRIGTTFADVVTVVPEPSIYALFAGFLALGGVMLRRRFRN